jgi:hypothetical protein
VTVERFSYSLDDALARRVADVLRRGLYEVVPREDVMQALLDADPQDEPIDLHHASSLLRCDKVRDARGDPLPDVSMQSGTARWIHYDGIAEGEPIERRIEAIGREHAECAAVVLSGTHADQERLDVITQIQNAVAATCGTPVEERPLVVEAATPWTPLHVSVFGDEILPARIQPDDDLCRLSPQVAWTGIDTPGQSDRPLIRIGVFQSHLRAGCMPDPLTVMRIVMKLRNQA